MWESGQFPKNAKNVFTEADNVVLEDVSTAPALGDPGSTAWPRGEPFPGNSSLLQLAPGSPGRRGMDGRKALSLIYV